LSIVGVRAIAKLKPIEVFDGYTVSRNTSVRGLGCGAGNVGRNQPGAVRIARATDEGEREVSETGRASTRGRRTPFFGNTSGTVATI
jgi:hypothetical protein